MKTFGLRVSAVLLLVMACFAPLAAPADSVTYEITLTNTQPITYSDPIDASGWLDKIEVITDVASTTTVTVATYSAGNQVIDTFYSDTISSSTTNGTDLARTRFIGTGNDGTALTAAAFAIPAGVSTNGVGTILVANYERPMLGGNLKVATTGTKNDGSCPVKVVIYFTPVDH